VLEATRSRSREVVDRHGKDSGITLDVLRADGGMVVNDLLMHSRRRSGKAVVRPMVKELRLSALPMPPDWPSLFSGYRRTRRQLGQSITLGAKMTKNSRAALSLLKKAVTRSFDGWNSRRGIARDAACRVSRRSPSIASISNQAFEQCFEFRRFEIGVSKSRAYQGMLYDTASCKIERPFRAGRLVYALSYFLQPVTLKKRTMHL